MNPRAIAIMWWFTMLLIAAIALGEFWPLAVTIVLSGLYTAWAVTR